MIFNANLDKSPSQRESLTELRAELKGWEELQRANAKKRQSGGRVGEDVVGYQVCKHFLNYLVLFCNCLGGW
jgi:E3 ubiquitin-protein ligase RAD18